MSTGKRSGSTGEVAVSEVRSTSKGVEILLEGEVEPHLIPPEVYSSHYIYPGKRMTREEWDSILEEAGIHSFMKYALELLSRRSYTSGEIIDRLIKRKEATYSVAKRVAEYLEDHSLIDDRALADELAQEMLSAGKSLRAVRQKLISRRVPIEIISQVLEGRETDTDTISSLLEAYVRTHSSLSNRALQQGMKAYLSRRGFSLEESSSLVGEFLSEHPQATDPARERRALEDNLERLLSRSPSLDGDAERDVVEKMSRKGFDASDVREALREREES